MIRRPAFGCRTSYFSTGWGVWDIITMMIFTLDICVKFASGAPDPMFGGAIAMDPKRVALLYVR